MTKPTGYGESKKGNFKIVDSIGVPHPFCIGTKHVTYASNNCGGMLGKEAMEAYPCYTCKKPLQDHKEALVVECKEDVQNNKELSEYLLKCKPKCEKDGFAGFTFLDRRNKENKK